MYYDVRLGKDTLGLFFLLAVFRLVVSVSIYSFLRGILCFTISWPDTVAGTEESFWSRPGISPVHNLL